MECRVRGAVQAGCRVECRVGGRAKGRVRGGVLRGVEGGVGGGVEDDAVRSGVGWDGKRQKWRAKSLRTPFYQYSIYNQKDVLIIMLEISGSFYIHHAADVTIMLRGYGHRSTKSESKTGSTTLIMFIIIFLQSCI